MKILIINTSDIRGGAARAAYRLHKALISQYIDSKMLVQRKSSDDFTVITDKSVIRKGCIKFRIMLDNILVSFYKNRTRTLFSGLWFPSSRIVKEINKINPDIVHLHWICDGMIKIEDLQKIKAPIVWTLHDNWLFTGGCHIMWDCDKYKQKCGACPRLGSKNENDLSKTIFLRKEKVFSKIDNMTIVGPSTWLSQCAKSSTLLKNKKHLVLPNPIDTNIFKFFDKEQARELWDLPKNKKLVLFGAIGATSDINKGFKELCEARTQLEEKEIEFVVFGSSEPEKPQDFGFKTHYLGHLDDDVSLVTLYSAVDVMVVPSLQENLSNTIMESLSCSTPVVSFDIGGNSDLIDHKKNGYLAKPFETKDLAVGIEWVINSKTYDALCQNAREKVLKEFDSKVVAKKYIELYNEVLNG